MGKGKRVVFYLRVSTGSQTVENQRQELAKAAEQRGWSVAELYSDNGVSGAIGREHRKAFDALLKAAARREFDMVAAWSVDRLGRSLRNLNSFLDEIHGAGVDLYLHQQGLDTSTPAGRAMFALCGIFAEFERALIVERVRAGLSRARAQGKRLGRPALPAETREKILAAAGAGNTGRAIARQLGISEASVRRTLAARG
jgi:DNA invertase Pin-like site-specific DNA recombinase